MERLTQSTTDEEFADLSTEDVSIDPQKEEIDQIDNEFTINDERLPGTAGKRNKEVNENEETTFHDKVQDIFEEQFIEKDPFVLESTPQQRKDNVNSTANIYVTPRKIVAVPQHIHCAYRGSMLQKLSLYEYTALVDIVPVRPKTDPKSASFSDQNTPGRPANGTISFATAHPLHSIEAQISFWKTKNNELFFLPFACNRYIHSKIAFENEGSSIGGPTTSATSTQLR
jgi:hypothetical protein